MAITNRQLSIVNYVWFNLAMGSLSNRSALRVIFMGMLGALSSLPLAVLIENGINVVAVIVPSDVLPVYRREGKGITAVSPPSPTILTVNQPNLLDLAFQHQIPLFSVDNLSHLSTTDIIQAFKPDVICVSCFSKRIPPAILQIPPLGVLNIHPSPLPYLRGPYPIFWTLRTCLRETAVTIHYMDARFDTGDLALGRVIKLKEGASGQEIDHQVGKVGGDALLLALKQLQVGALPRTPQNDAKATHAPEPQAKDFRLDSHWPAHCAFNFMRGTAHWGYPYPVEIAGKDILLQTAVSFDPHQSLPEPIIWQGQTVLVQMNPGVLTARLRL